MRSILSFASLTLVLSLAAQAAPEKMQAAEVGQGGLSVQTRPVPRPGAGEVLIKVRAAGVNPVDWKSALRRLGMVPGKDVSGTIDTLGEGVTGWKVGDPVLGFALQSGSYAEYAVIAVTDLARKPKSMTLRAGRGRTHRGRDRVSRAARSRPHRARPDRAHSRRCGWRGFLRRADRQGSRSARHRNRLA